MKKVYTIMAVGLLVALFVFVPMVRQELYNRQYIGHWSNISSNVIEISNDNYLAIRQDSGIVVARTKWIATNNELELGDAIGYENINSRYYQSEFTNNGKILRLTSEHGNVLVFRRISN